MSRLPKLSLLVSLLFLSSCSLFKELSSDDVTRITSEYFDENHDMVFYSTLSLLQAEQFTIVQADKESGIIRGTRHTERDDVERNLKTFGTATERESTEARIPHSTAFRQTYGGKALSLPERTDRYPQKRSQSKANFSYHALEGIDLRQMAEQIKSRSEKKKKARLIAAESLLFFKRHSICLSTSLVAISFDELF